MPGWSGETTGARSCWRPGSPISRPAMAWSCCPAEPPRGGPVRPQPVRMGRGAAHRHLLAHHLVGQFGDPCLGLPELRNPRCQPETTIARRDLVERRRLAQQSPRRPAFGPSWPHLVRDRHHLDGDPFAMVLGSRKNVALPSPTLARQQNPASGPIPQLARPPGHPGRRRRGICAAPAGRSVPASLVGNASRVRLRP